MKFNNTYQSLVFATYIGGSSTDYGFGVAVDPSGNVYATGFSFGPTTGRDYATIKYNPNGTEEWVARYNYSSHSDDQATAIAVDQFGNIYVTGESAGPTPQGQDYATVKYAPDGNILKEGKVAGCINCHTSVKANDWLFTGPIK